MKGRRILRPNLRCPWASRCREYCFNEGPENSPAKHQAHAVAYRPVRASMKGRRILRPNQAISDAVALLRLLQ